jgi:hypothetical protein
MAMLAMLQAGQARIALPNLSGARVKLKCKTTTFQMCFTNILNVSDDVLSLSLILLQGQGPNTSAEKIRKHYLTRKINVKMQNINNPTVKRQNRGEGYLLQNRVHREQFIPISLFFIRKLSV